MKKLYKRIISLSIAMILTLSFSTVAFANENNEKVNISTKEIFTDLISPNSIPDGYANITGIKSGTSTSAGLSIPFTVPQGGAYLYFKVASETSLNILIRKSNGITIIGEPIAASSETKSVPLHYRYVNEYYWPAGEYVLNVDFGQTGKAYAFCIVATEYPLN